MEGTKIVERKPKEENIEFLGLKREDVFKTITKPDGSTLEVTNQKVLKKAREKKANDLLDQGKTIEEVKEIYASQGIPSGGISSLQVENPFEVNILETAPSTDTSPHTFVSATANGLKRATFNLGVSSVTNCVEDVASILNAITHDITRGGNSKSVGAGLSYYNGTNLQHIVGVASETIDVFYRAAEISRSIINNGTWGSTGSGISSAVTG